jgi:(2R)-3-sulfolactate dehydrogenase (NADP+)
MIPMGEAKGAALALMVEILCATFAGANHSAEATSFFDAEGAPPGVGQTLIAFDVAAAPGGRFAARLESLLGAVEAQEGARLPGQRRLALRAAAARDGVAIPAHLHQEIAALAQPG